MRLLNLLIKICHHCPYCRNNQFGAFCGLSGKSIDNTLDEIPKWCPLPKRTEENNEK